MINFDFSTSSKPEAGSILISEPFLADHYFSRSVIYLCEHNENGSFGFVLNKYVDSSVNELLPSDFEYKIKVSIGGPVDNSNLFYLHSFGTELNEAIPIHKDIYIGGEFEHLKTLLRENPDNIKKIRFFIGYSGWSPGQLEDEINEKSWVVLNNIPAQVILDTSDENMWKTVMEKLGGKFNVMKDFPVDPSLN